MKFTLLPAAAALFSVASIVAAQNSTGDGAACTLCLQNSLRALPLCKDLNITMGNFDPSVSPAYAACLCSSLNGTWIDACAGVSQCGPDVEQFKNTYPSTIQDAGLQCNGTTPTFVPVATDSVLPTSALPTSSASPTSGSTKSSAGDMGAVPSALFTNVMGALALVAAVGASLI
ncbi:hypothetical protein EDD21DRAFT_363869 [Dissophora ornata]|nr:hypothetical protein BGZ58_010764 [Dissophora ornata]KAI8605311.1 hypothetical protein EDD21DRAFT_363869 [Dissophora ornata]